MLRWFAVRLAVLAVALAACEAVARGVYRLVEDRPIDLSAVATRRGHLATEARALDLPGARRGRDGRALHPYLGVVADPAAANDPTHDGASRVSTFGFTDDKEPILPASDDLVVVGLFGGTMARQVSIDGWPAIEAELARTPALRDKRITVVRVALDGGKQPQQLLALAWLLSLGAHFDAVVELDGFDEVTVPVTGNLPQGVHPSYPGAWGDALAGFQDPVQARYEGEIATITRIRGWWAELFEFPLLRSSAVGTLLWRAVDDLVAQRAVERRLALAEVRGQFEGRHDLARQGPPWHAVGDESTWAELARTWAESSLQMARLCRANGIRYLHVLQPSQYFPGSKPMADAERRIAVREDGEAARSVRTAYPLLRDASAGIERRGVRFHDLTGVFQGHEGQLYVDDRCGLNAEGAALVGRRVGRILARTWSATAVDGNPAEEPRAPDAPPAESSPPETARTPAPAGTPPETEARDGAVRPRPASRWTATARAAYPRPWQVTGRRSNG